jgi:chromosomal replication initiator protein
MAKSLDEAWAETLSRTSRKLSTSPSFHWLKDTRPSQIKANTLTVTVPSEFAKNWIESHYREDLGKAWKEAWGEACDLRFTVISQEKMVPSTLFPGDGRPIPARKRKTVPDVSQYLKGLNPRYVFENFIVEPQTGSPTPPLWRWLRAPQRYTTHSLFMAALASERLISCKA